MVYQFHRTGNFQEFLVNSSSFFVRNRVIEVFPYLFKYEPVTDTGMEDQVLTLQCFNNSFVIFIGPTRYGG